MDHKDPTKPASRRKFFIFGAVAAVIILAVVGIAVGVVVSKNNNKSTNLNSGTTSGSNSGNSTGGGGGTTNSTGSGGGTDPNLRRVFWAMAYAPDWALEQYGCNFTQSQVTRDVQLLTQLTKRIRLYSGECNQTAMVFEAIKQTKSDLLVYPGIYVVENDDAAYTEQRDAVLGAVQTYGADHVLGITVGNEFMLNYLNAHGATDPNTPTGDQGAQILIAKINDTRSALSALKLSKNLPVGNSEAGYYYNNHVMAAIDYGMANVHAWFANTTIADAADWVITYFNETNVGPAALLPNNPKMYIAETGWPTASSSLATSVNGAGAQASVPNLQIFIDNFVCKANSNGVGYFFFEYVDEQWKELQFGNVEGHWGLFDKNYNLKNITLPNCLAP